jgi:hypothetical protein
MTIISSLEQPSLSSTNYCSLDPLSKLSSHLQNSQAEISKESPKSGNSDTATTKIDFIPAQIFNKECIIELTSHNNFYNSNGKVFKYFFNQKFQFLFYFVRKIFLL